MSNEYRMTKAERKADKQRRNDKRTHRQLPDEHLDDPLRDPWNNAGISDDTPVDTAIKMNGRNRWVT